MTLRRVGSGRPHALLLLLLLAHYSSATCFQRRRTLHLEGAERVDASQSVRLQAARLSSQAFKPLGSMDAIS